MSTSIKILLYIGFIISLFGLYSVTKSMYSANGPDPVYAGITLIQSIVWAYSGYMLLKMKLAGYIGFIVVLIISVIRIVMETINLSVFPIEKALFTLILIAIPLYWAHKNKSIL